MLVGGDFENILNISNKIEMNLKNVINDNININNELVSIITNYQNSDLIIDNNFKNNVNQNSESNIVLVSKIINKLKSILFSNAIISNDVFFELIQKIYNENDIDHVFELNDKEKRIINRLRYDIIHNIIVNIKMQDFNSSGRNILDVFDTDIKMQDFDSSGRNILDITNINFIFKNPLTFQTSHVINLISG